MTAQVNFLPIYEATEPSPAAAVAVEGLKASLLPSSSSSSDDAAGDFGRRLSDASSTGSGSSSATTADDKSTDSNGREMDLLPIFED